MIVTSQQRISIALSAGTPDRVPLAMPFTFYGAKISDVSIADYYERAELVVSAQIRLLRQFRQDAVFSSFYTALQIEAWGGEVSFSDTTAPSVEVPVVRRPEDINNLEQPKIRDCKPMLRCLDVTRRLRRQLGDDTAIAATVVSPFSLPLLQMGEAQYAMLIEEQPRLYERLIAINEELCVEWSNALFNAGVSYIICSDPAASSPNLARDVYLRLGFPVLCSYLSRMNGPIVLSTYPSDSLPIVDQAIQCGAKAIVPNKDENADEVRAASRGQVALVGGIDTAKMRTWDCAEVESEVKTAIAKAGVNGGLILSDSSGDVGWSVSQGNLAAIADAAHIWGRYPLWQAVSRQ